MDRDFYQRLSLIKDELARICSENAIKIVTAESCTGGGIAYELTTLPGSSQWFERGFVPYSHLAKIEMLGVQERSIEEYGAVSQEVAIQMAEGAIRFSSASVSLSVTGIAGPEGGSEQKPVGTCWFAWSGTRFATLCKAQLFRGDRCMIRSNAILFSLDNLLQLIRANYCSS
jgi:nicotinamide-nucleotide amidase